jgi:transposase
VSHVTIGLDVSKGYVDVLTLDEDGVLSALNRFDDGPMGHDHLWTLLDDLAGRYDTVAVGVESTGGLERNWKRCVLAWCKARSVDRKTVRFELLDPRVVKRTAETLGTRCKTDQSSARAIAECLHRQHGTTAVFDDTEAEAMRGWFRALCAADQRATELLNQIKSLLPQVHPALVPHLTNNGLPNWAMELLKAYPTAERLAQARVKTVAKIPMITEAKARQLIDEAKRHQMAATGAINAIHMTFLVESLATIEQTNLRNWKILEQHFNDSSEALLMQSIPGVGIKTSAAMLAETGTLTRFVSADALIAYCGLDPVFEQSGDGIINKGISRKGPAKLRAMLFNAARSAVMHNPIIKSFYQRLTANGKPHFLAMAACMAKIVRIMYACVITGTAFDPTIQEKNLERCGGDQRAKEPLGRKEVPHAVRDALAPLSRKEKQRRKVQERQQTDDSVRGQCLNAEPPAVAGEHALGRLDGKSGGVLIMT